MNLEKMLLMYREKNNLTQEMMAKKLGCSLSSYRRWEMGVTTPNSENVVKILKMLSE